MTNVIKKDIHLPQLPQYHSIEEFKSKSTAGSLIFAIENGGDIFKGDELMLLFLYELPSDTPYEETMEYVRMKNELFKI
jgi:hypothetical protein